MLYMTHNMLFQCLFVLVLLVKKSTWLFLCAIQIMSNKKRKYLPFVCELFRVWNAKCIHRICRNELEMLSGMSTFYFSENFRSSVLVSRIQRFKTVTCFWTSLHLSLNWVDFCPFIQSIFSRTLWLKLLLKMLICN